MVFLEFGAFLDFCGFLSFGFWVARQLWASAGCLVGTCDLTFSVGLV